MSDLTRDEYQQMIYALDRAARRNEYESEQLGMDYAAEIPAEDARYIRVAIEILEQSLAELDRDGTFNEVH